MNRHRAYWPLDDAPVPDGDGRFLGVNARVDPAQLAEGELSAAVNCRFDEGRIATRKGARIMPWGIPGVQGAAPELIVPYGPVRRASAFKDPITGLEWVIVVRDGDNDLPLGASYRSRPGNTGALLSAPADTDWTSVTDLIQTYNGMVALRGPDLAPLYLVSVDEGWRELPPAADTKEAIPPSSDGIYFANRLFVIDGRDDGQHADSLWVSDIGGVGSVLQGDEVGLGQSFRINQGSADRLVAVAKFNDTTIVALKERSVFVVSSVYGTNDQIGSNARLDSVTDQYGCMAPRSVVQVGKDLWFLGHRRGICSIQQTNTNALQGVDVAVSRDIQPIIDRINWDAAGNATAAAWDNRVFFAVPIDGATDNNAILVFSTLTGKWAGYDQSDATKVRDWVAYTYGGAVRLGFLSTDGFVYLWEDGYTDDVGDEGGHITRSAVEIYARTRAYGGRESGVKRFTRCEIKGRTWDAVAEIQTTRPGIVAPRSVLALAVDNTRYVRPFGRARWNASNGNGDWDTPGREDYAVAMDGPAGAGVQVTDGAGSGTIGFGVLEPFDFARRLGERGSGLMLEITSTRGRLEIAGISVEAQRGNSHDSVVR